MTIEKIGEDAGKSKYMVNPTDGGGNCPECQEWISYTENRTSQALAAFAHKTHAIITFWKRPNPDGLEGPRVFDGMRYD